MEYRETIRLRDGRECLLRAASEEDGPAVLDVFIRIHAQTDYLLTYPDETAMTAEQESDYLRKKRESRDEIEILALVDGTPVGTAGISRVGTKDKIKHRAEFGISVDKAFWGLGIGRALTRACIACAAEAGYAQLELAAVAENERALALYRSEGFTEYGRNPRGFRSRRGLWQELVLMRLELGAES
jgi:RimJ/RimL family protein N-acetyltransferase